MNLPNEDEVRSIVRQMLQQMAANGKPCMVSGVFGPPDEIKNKDYRNSFAIKLTNHPAAIEMSLDAAASAAEKGGLLGTRFPGQGEG